MSMGTMLLATVVLGATCGAVHAQTSQKGRLDLGQLFTPSGWIGDGTERRQYINFSDVDTVNPHSPPSSIKIVYSFGPTRWGGMYWQNEPDNWGDLPGTNFSGRGFTKVTFWARGETGTEVVEFKVGGIDNRTKKHRDSFRATIGRVALTKEWKQYHIDIGRADLSSVIGGFCWVASADYNKAKQIVFFLDDIFLE